MNRPKLIMLALLLVASSLNGQDVEQEYAAIRKSAKENPLSAQGSIGASAVFYKAENIAPRRDPFYWVLNANLNFRILDKIDVPFSAILTQQDKNFSNGLDKFSQPFNQFGISPRYKWLTVHAGYRSLELSQFSLAGAIFLGGGLEIKPVKSFVQGTALYGRFVKAIPKGGVAGVVVSVPAYERNGAAAKIRTGTASNYVDLILMKLSDNKYSIAFDTALTATPMQNQVITINTSQKLRDKLRFSADWSYSIFTENMYQAPTDQGYTSFQKKRFAPRPSTRFSQAIYCTMDYDLRNIQLGLSYKKIDPDYRSLGAIFLTNDVEESSVRARFSLFRNKLSANLAGGLQRNNLDKVQQQTSSRMIASAEIGLQPCEQLQISGNYSGFSSNTVPVRNVITDSIQLLQIASTRGLNANYRVEGKNCQAMFVVQGLNQTSVINKTQTGEMESANINASMQGKRSGFNLQAGYSLNRTSSSLFITTGRGPTLGLSKAFIRNRLRMSYTFTSQEILTNGISSSTVYNHAFNLGLKLRENQDLRIDAGMLDKKAIQSNVSAFREWRGSISYQVSLSAKKKKSNK